jgi:membrane-associated PAP2 superfamily phosphatase
MGQVQAEAEWTVLEDDWTDFADPDPCALSTPTTLSLLKDFVLPWFPLLLLVPYTELLDLSLAKATHTAVPGPKGDFISHFVSDALYNYGVLPAYVMACGSLGALVLSLFWQPLRAWRPALWSLVLTVLFGCVLGANCLLKDQWGRPRPCELRQFGGTEDYRPFYTPNFTRRPATCRSFPCGHACAGFCFFIVGRLFRRNGRQRLARASYSLAWMLGSALGAARIAQGGHFFSDAVASASLMWSVSAMVEHLVFKTFTTWMQRGRVHEGPNRATTDNPRLH